MHGEQVVPTRAALTGLGQIWGGFFGSRSSLVCETASLLRPDASWQKGQQFCVALPASLSKTAHSPVDGCLPVARYAAVCSSCLVSYSDGIIDLCKQAKDLLFCVPLLGLCWSRLRNT
jgi:hypothetical protein